MWLCRGLGVVACFTAHKRGQSKRHRLTTFSLYHWRAPCLMAKPANWRDFDMNSSGWDVHEPMPGKGIPGGGETWEYVGNLFELLPYEMLAREKP